MTTADPFGLWEPAEPALAAGGLSFGAPGQAEAAPAMVWSVDLDSGPAELERRAARLRAVEAGLDQSEARLEAFLARRAAGQDGPLPRAFDLMTDSAEAGLEQYFQALEGLDAPAGEPEHAPDLGLEDAVVDSLDDRLGGGDAAPVAFGLRQVLERAAAPVLQRLETRLPLRDLRDRLDGLVAAIQQQALHLAWVETRSGATLLARTAVQWGGSAHTIWQPSLPAETVAAHQRSLALAAQSRAANLRALLAVTRLAGKIALAAATPPGPLHLSLAWQFINEVIRPLLEQAEQTA